MNSEITAELALELRTSLSTIRECAATMGSKADATSIAQLARDIAAQTEHLEKVVGGFLAGGGRMRASAAGA
jgi:signal transduction histidine kinase